MKYIIGSFLLLFICACTGDRQGSHTETSNQDTFLAPKVTVLADLPDSLQPQTRALDNAPKPKTIVVPTRSGGSYSITNAKGEVHKISLEPPVNRSLPVLRDANGEVIRDSAGNTFIMGDGGLSNFTNFTTDDGLALDGISGSIVDKTGNLWFATQGGGVSRYDGKSFTNFSPAQGLANNSVMCLCEDKTGNLWFGTWGAGVSRYDGKSFKTFSTAQGLANDEVLSIYEDKTGNLWFGTSGGGVSRYDGKSFKTFSTAEGLANNGVLSICEDRTGNLWFGTKGGGVSRYDGKSFKTFSTAEGLANNKVLSICEDKTGNLWFGTKGGGVSRYDGKSFKTFSTGSGLASNHVLAIYEDETGNIWFGTESGVSRYDGKSFANFSTAQGLAGKEVTSICEDRTGSLWFSSNGGGASRYDGKSFINFSTPHGLPHNMVFSICEDKTGNFWFGTWGEGVSRYDGRSFTNFSTAQGLVDNNVWSIAEDKKGNLWFTTEGGVSRYDGRSFTNFSTAQGLASNRVRAICEDKTGNLWFGTEGEGVSRYDGKSFTNFSTAQGLANNYILSICEDKMGNLWFGTVDGGVSRYDGRSFTNLSTAQGLAANKVYGICEDKAGNLWFGTTQGLSVMSVQEVGKLEEGEGAGNITGKSGPGRRLFKTFTTTAGLPDNLISQVSQMPNGKMAIGTNLGIALFSPSEDLTRLDNIEIYNSNTGCPVKDVNTGKNCMLFDSKGIIWAGTGSEKTAVVRFDPSALRNNKNAPTLRISGIKVNEEDIDWYNLERTKGTKTDGKFSAIEFDSITCFYPIPEHLVLPYDHNRITIDFNAVERSKPSLVNYQYMLEGYDKGWSPVMKKTSATFGNIHEGIYTFKVKAQGPNGVWSEPVTYLFKVLPPWYRTWWAYILYVLSASAILYSIFRWRTRSLLQRQKELEQTVDKRTEELVQKNKVVEQEKHRSEELLLNILPGEVAEELKAKGTIAAKHFDNVTVLFTDFVSFTQAGEHLSAQSLVDELHTCFKAFDEITGKYNIEKIKTVGDAYLAVAGLPSADPDHAENVVKAAIEINAFMVDRLAKLGSEHTFNVRIGVHSGNVVAGIVGVKKFAYDIWGDTVNTAARMEQNSKPGRINISETTYQLVNRKFNCEYRGEINAKGKGHLKMYFVSSVSNVFPDVFESPAKSLHA